MESFTSEDEQTGGVSVHQSREGITISIWGNILFDSGKASIKTGSSHMLESLASTLVRIPNDIRIEGHTDNIPINTPLYPSNWELSTTRATSVARYLASLEVNEKRMGAVGYGEFRPIVDNDSREHRARNRRVDILVIYPEAPSLIPDLKELGEASVGDEL